MTLPLSSSSTMLVVCVCLSFFVLTSGYIQRLVVYESIKDDGDFVGVTRQGVDDVQTLPLMGIKRMCAQGWWLLYNSTKYEEFWKPIGPSGCKTENFDTVKSFRRIGAKNTDDDILSLYEKENYSGKETQIAGRVKGTIPQPVRSLGRTGSADWTLYEDNDFDSNPGTKSYCLKGTSTGFSFARDITATYNLTRIGSVAKGCK